jgi:hypothetical protein
MEGFSPAIIVLLRFRCSGLFQISSMLCVLRLLALLAFVLVRQQGITLPLGSNARCIQGTAHTVGLIFGLMGLYPHLILNHRLINHDGYTFFIISIFKGQRLDLFKYWFIEKLP